MLCKVSTYVWIKDDNNIDKAKEEIEIQGRYKSDNPIQINIWPSEELESSNGKESRN